MSNGTQTAVVPGQTTGTTPPFQQPSQQIDEQTRSILVRLIQAAAQKRAAGQPRPTPPPARQDPFAPPSYMTSGPNPHAWGAQRLMYGIQSMMKNAVSHHKEEQINKAMADWEYAQSALNEYYAAQTSGDPKQLEQAQKKLDVVFGDLKKLKNMAEALNQDWLNPEKTKPYGEALKRVAAKTQQTDSQKQQAKQGLMGVFRKLMQRRQQPQLTGDETKRMEQEVISKAPTTTGGLDINSLKTIADVERAVTEAKEKYQFVPAQDGSGTVWAVNKSNPKDAHVLRDAETGESIKGGKTPPKEGQVYSANGVPLGVFHKGRPVMPGDAEWSDSDAKMYSAALDGMKEKQTLRVDPIVAAEVGNPPNPKDYAKGRSDPKYGEALKVWGQQSEAVKTRMAGASGEARAKAFNEYRPVQVMDDDGNVYYTTAKAAIEQGQAGAGEGVKLKPREQQIKDIQVASKTTRDAINNLDKPFSPAQIAKLHYAMETEDPSLANTELSTLATQDLTDKQQDFVIWVRQLNERAMSLRNVAGMGTGAQDLRTAIRAMIPGIRSGDKKMMNKQLDAFDNQVSILAKGIAHPGKDKPKDSDPLGILK